jgi:hypothetical protein
VAVVSCDLVRDSDLQELVKPVEGTVVKEIEVGVNTTSITRCDMAKFLS